MNKWTKSKLNRIVPVPKSIIDILADKKDLKPSHFVFSLFIPFNTLGHRFLKPVARQAGVTPICFHDLRHTFASHCVIKGMHPVEIRDLLGHRRLSRTNQYMHLKKDYLDGATECLMGPVEERKSYWGDGVRHPIVTPRNSDS